MERFFILVQSVVFRRIGNSFPTNSFKRFMDRLFVTVEKIGSKFQIFSEQYLNMYQEIVEKEIRMSPVKKKDRILIIGSGSLPTTAVLFALKTKASIVAIDKDPQAVDAATNYVKQFSLGNRLIIEHADGFSYPLSGFDVIVVLYGVTQQAEMIEHLAIHMHSDTRVIVRIVTDTKGNILDDQINLSKYFVVKEQARSESLGSVVSFLLMKKPSG